ncbi:hypothetical protein [Paracoccus sediminilitoris]|uniref:hypothetical protein n=1 Tax=Paracoccus sediminilitoris TaxID=2202419 RepID=UPI0011B93DA2|nr:hypothetical protein [Paracoccus sediminilitoris]
MKKANPLLAAMGKKPEHAPLTELTAEPVSKKHLGKRSAQKHLGAYFDKGDPTLERVAILRARLDMTNSELIEHALNELWKKHEAGRAFGD